MAFHRRLLPLFLGLLSSHRFVPLSIFATDFLLLFLPFPLEKERKVQNPHRLTFKANRQPLLFAFSQNHNFHSPVSTNSANFNGSKMIRFTPLLGSFSVSTSLPFVLLLLLPLLPVPASAEVLCPRLPSGVELTCGVACCISYEGDNHGYYCCQADDKNVVKSLVYRDPAYHQPGRPERYSSAVYHPGGFPFQIDYTLLIVGLIVSILLSILFSFICCLLCNGCWLHRRRNPHMYENVNERGDGESGFYPICCGFGIPVGTVVFSTHPPQFRDEVYGGSSASAASRGGRVRFNEDGTPKGVLKNGNGNDGFH